MAPNGQDVIDFFASLSWIGWLLIALAGFTLWHLRGIVRMALFGDRLSKSRPMHHGQGATDTDTDAGTD